MVNLGKEIENDKKWNEKKLGPCMNVFLNFDPYTTLDLFHPKQWLQKRSNIKEIETWKVANRLWNGKMIKKLPMLKANSVLRATNKASADQVTPLLLPSVRTHTFHVLTYSNILLICCNSIWKFPATILNLQQLYLICSNFINFLICSFSLVGHRKEVSMYSNNCFVVPTI